jgi:hypothetical protein
VDTLSSGQANEMNFASTKTFSLTKPVYSQGGNLEVCPPITSIGVVLDSSENDVSSDFTFSLTNSGLEMFTELDSHAGDTFHIELESTSSATDGLEENAMFYFEIQIPCSTEWVSLNSGWSSLTTEEAPGDVVVGETVTFSVVKPVYIQNGSESLTKCPAIVSRGNVYDFSNNDVTS